MGMGDCLLAIKLFGYFDSVIGGVVGRCGDNERGDCIVCARFEMAQ